MSKDGATIHINGAEAAITDLIIAGWTGRNQDQVEAHIRELEKLGVSRPRTTPIFYRVAASLLTQAARIQVSGTQSSGEAEPVLIATRDRLWVGVGSDHTDRDVETYDVSVSKQVCSKPLSTGFWAFDDVAGHWDSLVLRSYAHHCGAQILYQEGTLDALRRPEDLMSRYTRDGELLEQSVMFCGTLALKGDVLNAKSFTVELEDPVLGRTISHTYTVESLPRQ